MERSTCNIKKILIFPEMKSCTFQQKPSKFFLKKFLKFFPKKPALKKFLIFSYISRNGTLHFLTQAQQIKEMHRRKQKP